LAKQITTMAGRKSRKPKKDVVIAFRLPSQLKEAVEKKAEADGRTVANYVAWLVTRHIADNEKNKPKSG